MHRFDFSDNLTSTFVKSFISSKLFLFLQEKMKPFLFISILVISISSFADTGIFYSEGGNLFPIQETSISMQKEVLHFKYTPEGLEVNVYFEFNNPGEARNEIVGFVVPDWWGGDIEHGDFDPEKELRHPYVYDFMVAQNNKILTYKVSQFSKKGFNTDIDGVKDNDYIYYFNLNFEPGVNKIYCHYTFKGSYYKGDESFLYRLKTGKMWANQTIGDFTMVIDAKKKWFEIPETLSKSVKKAPWKIEGIGKLNEKYPEYTLAYIHSGFITLHMTNLKPDYDINLGFYGLISYYRNFEHIYCDGDNSKLPDFGWFIGSELADDYKEPLEKAEDNAIQDMINFLYAIHGYNFNGNDIADYFTQFTWYIPDPQLNAKDIKFTLKEQAFLTALVKERTKRRE